MFDEHCGYIRVQRLTTYLFVLQGSVPLGLKAIMVIIILLLNSLTSFAHGLSSRVLIKLGLIELKFPIVMPDSSGGPHVTAEKSNVKTMSGVPIKRLVDLGLLMFPVLEKKTKKHLRMTHKFVVVDAHSGLLKK